MLPSFQGRVVQGCLGRQGGSGAGEEEAEEEGWCAHLWIVVLGGKLVWWMGRGERNIKGMATLMGLCRMIRMLMPNSRVCLVWSVWFLFRARLGYRRRNQKTL